MKKQYTLIAFILALLSPSAIFAQMVGDCVFLQAASLEVGINPLGAFGSSRSAPAGYHASGSYSLYDPGSGTYYSTNLLGFVADPAQDGWTVGSPPMFGDYFLPGTPQEGWSIQVNGTESDAWTQALQFGPTTGFSGTLAGNNVSYSSSGGISTGVWQGTSGPLSIRQTTTLNASKLYFIINVVIKNTSGAVANNIYYLRTLDPDNEEEQSGSFTTINNIAYQLPNPGNKVMVTATGTTYSAAFLGLGTKDCRAKCFMIDFGLTPSYTLDQLYNQSTPYYYTVGSTYTEDAGIGLVYKLGNLNPGDSTSITYAYVMRAADLDSALEVTSPTIAANSSLLTPGSDTINACASGLDSVSVAIANGGSYTWTWSPATGLSSTTGTSVTVHIDSLTGETTYTVIGTPTSSALCANDTFHFTILPGTSAAPGVAPVYYCQGDPSVPLTATGTSLLWYTSATGGTGSPVAPTPSTGTPGVFTWWVTQNLGVCGESVRAPITVTVTAPPHVLAGSNSPVCSNGTLNLTATDTVTDPAAVYTWAGPLGFTTTVRNPSIVNPPVSATGWYHVSLNVHGCVGQDSTYVVIHPSPVLTTSTMISPSACNLSDGSITVYGLTPDSTYTLFYSFNGGTPVSITVTAGASGAAVITGLHAGVYSNIYVINMWGCASNALTVTLPDGVAPAAPTATSNGPICADSTLYLSATDTATGVVYHWSGPNGFTSTLQNPVITNASTYASGTYFVSITVISSGCVSASGSVAVVVKPTPTVPNITSNSPVCDSTSLELHATSTPSGATYAWSGPAGFTSASANPVISPATLASSGVYSVVATLNGCPSLPGTFNAVVNPIPAPPAASDATWCQYDAATPLTAAGSDLWYTAATGGTGSATAPTPPTSAPGITTWYVSQVVLGCESPRRPVNVLINPKPVVSITPNRSYVCQADTVTLCATGAPVLPGATYHWGLPDGVAIVSGTDTSSGCITVRADSAGNRQVALTIMANGCSTTNFYTLHIVPMPTTGAYISGDICVNDTTTLALTYVSPGITSFTWHTDSTHLHIISGTTTGGGGGPWQVSWDTAGIYIIGVRGYSTQEQCPSLMMYDTVHVHALPDATFTTSGAACAGDSVLFTATSPMAGDTYTWAPAAFFPGTPNAPSVYGVVLVPGYVTLTVTDPFGCHATDSLYMNPGSCCLVNLPDAFTPNGDGHNDRFRLITNGHHLLNVFRIVNRWGTTVYETTNSSDPGWDGTHGGEPQDMGTYFWYLKYSCDGNVIERSGSVTLIR